MMKILAALVVSLMLGACASENGSGNKEPLIPFGQEILASDVVEALQEAGLEAEDARPMTVEDFGLAPKRTDDAARFFIPSLGPDNGGRAFTSRTQKTFD